MPSPTAKCVFLFLVAWAASSLPAQTTAPAPQAPRTGQRVGQEPCWQEAGVPRSAVAQRRGIERGAKMQVASVCADATLTPQQKRAKIREIRRRARQQTEALVSPEQQQAIRACEESRGGGPPAGGGMPRAKGAGPCGEMAAPGPNPPTAQPVPESSPQP